MLVLSRKNSEAVIINDNIRVVVVSINKDEGKVRLGFDAPSNIAVHREEVWLEIQKERVDA